MEIRHVPPMTGEYEQDTELGLVSIPCLKNAKAAAVLWKHLQDRMPTAAELSQYVAMYRAGYNRAILCGARSDVVVIDLDDVPRGLALRPGNIRAEVIEREPGIVELRIDDSAAPDFYLILTLWVGDDGDAIRRMISEGNPNCHDD